MNKYIKILLLGSYIWFFGEGLLGPLYAVFAQHIGGNILELTGAFSLYLIIMGMLSLCFGRISDHYSQKNLMIFGYGLNAAATFGYLLVDNPIKLFLIQGILGVASALATPTWNALYSKHLDKKHFGEEWGLDDGGSEIIIGLAVITGGLIITYFSFPVLFMIMGTIQVLATIVQAYYIYT
jgi:MFS family permease